MAETVRHLAFETPAYKGIVIRVFYLDGVDGTVTADADVEIVRDGTVIETLTYPAYKVWNLAAHAEDIIDGEEAGNSHGWFLAGSDGLGGVVLPVKKEGRDA